MSYLVRDKVGIPNVFLLSPPRTATTSLAYWLGQHPDVCVSNKKEPKYLRTEYHNGTAWYCANYFKHWSGEKIVIDMAPGNFGAMFTAPRMAETSPGAKLIMVLRDPLERAMAEYRMYKALRPGRVRPTFEEEITRELNMIGIADYRYEPDYVANIDSNGICYDPMFLQNSCYGERLEHWLNYFPPESFLIYNFSDIKARPNSVLSDIFLNLGLERAHIDMNEKNTVNVKNIIKSEPIVSKYAYSAVSDIFKQDAFKVIESFKKMGVPHDIS